MDKKLQKKIAMTLSEESVLALHNYLKETKKKFPKEWAEYVDFSQQAKIFESALIERKIAFTPIILGFRIWRSKSHFHFYYVQDVCNIFFV